MRCVIVHYAPAFIEALASIAMPYDYSSKDRVKYSILN